VKLVSCVGASPTGVLKVSAAVDFEQGYAIK